MRLRVVGYKHYIISGGKHNVLQKNLKKDSAPKQLISRNARKFWHDYLDYTDLKQAYAILITDGGKVIAFFRYILHNARLTAIGTWVSPQHRRLGLGRRMWEHVLDRNKVKKIEVFTASKKGEELIKKITSLYPKIIWEI